MVPLCILCFAVTCVVVASLCIAVLSHTHSGDVLGELVRGYLHLQMAHLSIIHHVFEYFISVFVPHQNVNVSLLKKRKKKCSDETRRLPSLWNTESL